MNQYGHNETAVRLAALAGDAQVALDRVARGEADAIEGWLAYGAALNEGRALFPGDREFSAWMAEWQLAIQVEAHERAAAMWAAANADQLAEAQAACKARTLRGWHDQWKKIEQEREAARKKAEREAEEARKRGETVTVPQPKVQQPAVKVRTTKNLSIKMVARAASWRLESTEDVDKYLDALRQSLLKELADDSIVNVEL